MARFPFYGFLIVCLLARLAASAYGRPDTTVYQLRGVEVFGKPAEVYAAGSRIPTIDSSYLAINAAGSLALALQARTSLYVKQYGPGGISTVTFRGTSAQHTAVLWNGLNITSPSLGQSDFTTLPLSAAGSIAVQHGGTSALYGSGAVGGAVLLNPPTYSKGLHATVQQEAGSFNRYFSKAAISYGNEKVTIGGSIFWQKAQNNFLYRDLSKVNHPLTRQDHAASLQRGFTQDLTWKLSGKGKLSFHSWYTDTDRNIQPAMGAVHNNAAYADQNFRLSGTYSLQTWLGETTLKAAYFSDYLQYSSTNLTAVTAVNTYQTQAEQTYIYGRRWNLKAGINLQYFEADVDGYGRQVTENRSSLFLLTRFDPTDRVSLSLNMRQAFAEGYNPPPTPAFGMNWKVLEASAHQFILKGNVAGSYRLPTLNERFWQPGGNPELKPEQGYQAEAGLAHAFELHGFKLNTEVTPYIMTIANWVEWRTSDNRSTPVNLQRVLAQGVEFSSHATQNFNDIKLDASFGYTYSSSRQVASAEGGSVSGNQLPYIPMHKATLRTGINYKSWSLNSNAIYNSKRFTSGSNTIALAPFALLDAGIGKHFSFGKNKLQTAMQVHNVTNSVYQTMQNYAMPPRQYSIQISYTISNQP